MRIERVKIERLVEWNKNPRKASKGELERLRRQIEKLGIYKPLVVTEDGGGRYLVLGGNMRLKVLREMGVKEVDVSVVKAEGEEERMAYNLSDNDMVGSYIEDELREVVKGLKSGGIFELEDFKVGLNGGRRLDKLIREVVRSDELEESVGWIKGKRIMRKGDVVELGGHRLVCGDFYDDKDLEKMVEGVKLDVVLTDPPYGINVIKGEMGKVGGAGGLGGKRKDARIFKRIEGDDKRIDISKVLGLAEKVFVFGGNYFADKLPVSGGWIVWDKERPEGTNFSEVELVWSNLDMPARIVRWLWHGMARRGERSVEMEGRMMLAQKPVGVLEWILERFCDGDKVVCDPFAGSGSVMLAAERRGMRCVMMEIESLYCDLIIKRWCEYSGERINKVIKNIKKGGVKNGNKKG